MTTENQPTQVLSEDFLVLGHLVKYNLYMLAKAIVFASILDKANGDIVVAVEEANATMEALDLDSQRRKAESAKDSQASAPAEQ